jgi:fluoride exporter
MQAAMMVALGGAIGSVLRFGVNELGVKGFGTSFPLHTLFVNVVGCFAMGIVTGLAIARMDMTENLRLFLTTGLLGGFTTFSAFALDFAMLTKSSAISAATYAILTVVLSLVAVFAGLALAR